MPHARASLDHQRLDALFAQRGVLTSAQIQQALGLSQASVSRLVNGISGVVKVGKARASRYVKTQMIADELKNVTVLWSDREGRTIPFGQLWLSARNDVLVLGVSGKVWQTSDRLPWFMATTRLQGYIARQVGRPYGLDNPERWTVQQQLMIATRQQVSAFGAIHLNLPRQSGWVERGDLLQRLEHYDTYLSDKQQAPAGSSAGGEQAKFESTLANGEQLIIKYSPPRGTPFGERWHDLLCAEHLALETLAQHGVAVAHTRFACTSNRSYLEIIRFDKTGSLTRPNVRHIVPLHAIHAEFIGGSQQDWARSCNELTKQKRLPVADASLVQALLAFGHMIANTDMHFGNLSFFVDSVADLEKGQFTLAPCYDMLPMRYRPDGGAVFDADYAEFDPFAKHETMRSYGVNQATLDMARQWALTFWQAASLDVRLSAGFRALSHLTVHRLSQDVK